MTGELFRHLTGVNLVSVNYKGGGAATMAIVSGEVKAGFGTIPNVLPHVTAGKLKAYMITSGNRFPGAREIPTAAEAGLPDFESQQWLGMLAPARTPDPIIGKLNRDAVEFLQTSELRAAFRAQGAEPAPGTAAEFAAFIKSETVTLKKVIEVAGIRAE
jgi:tripartite-type tricarboxylate transporter receptor subunit TctC